MPFANKNTQKIVLIGAGHVATHLGKRLQKKEHELLQVLGKSEESAKELALLLKTPFTTSLSKINRHADVYILCVPDDEIRKIAASLRLPRKLVLHTSGSEDLSALKPISSNTGVLYPLYSFSKQVKVSFSSVPFLIEASNKTSFEKLEQLANTLSGKAVKVNSKDRLKIHLAAVLVNNFCNHIYTQSYDYLKKEKINLFHLLQPLIKQTAKKIKSQPPALVQTGPARRNDKSTIKKHLDLLARYPSQKEIYSLFTTLIKNYYHA